MGGGLKALSCFSGVGQRRGRGTVETGDNAAAYCTVSNRFNFCGMMPKINVSVDGGQTESEELIKYRNKSGGEPEVGVKKVASEAASCAYTVRYSRFGGGWWWWYSTRSRAGGIFDRLFLCGPCLVPWVCR